MNDDEKTNFDILAIRNKVKLSKEGTFDVSESQAFDSEAPDRETSWRAVSGILDNAPKLHAGGVSPNGENKNTTETSEIDFVGKNLEGGKFVGENLENASFSVANLTGVDFSGCNLKGVDFSGANMTDANLSGADLSGAVLSGTVLKNANFTGAKLHGVKLSEADIEGALLLDIDIDELGIEELQALVEYLAKYYPHKLNLARINLTLLDLSKVDLSKVSLRGVDFTGVNFRGVNIAGLDLSECKITPEQIAQALGRVPTAEEMKKIMAPKKPKAKRNNFDLEGLFFGRGKFGIIDATKGTIGVEQLLKLGKKVLRRGGPKPPVKDTEALDHIRGEREAEVKSHNAELAEVIKRRKEEMRAQMEKEKQAKTQENVQENAQEKTMERTAEKNRDMERLKIERMKDVRSRD